MGREHLQRLFIDTQERRELYRCQFKTVITADGRRLHQELNAKICIGDQSSQYALDS